MLPDVRHDAYRYASDAGVRPLLAYRSLAVVGLAQVSRRR